MALYEHVFLARQDLAQAQVDALAETATKIISDNGGKVTKTDTSTTSSAADSHGNSTMSDSNSSTTVKKKHGKVKTQTSKDSSSTTTRPRSTRT